jgi:hypothetical protein
MTTVMTFDFTMVQKGYIEDVLSGLKFGLFPG